MFALVEPEGLFVEIGVKVNRINADVGSLESPFEQAPKILNVVSVDVAMHELDSVIYRLVRVGVGKTKIRFLSAAARIRV